MPAWQISTPPSACTWSSEPTRLYNRGSTAGFRGRGRRRQSRARARAARRLPTAPGSPCRARTRAGQLSPEPGRCITGALCGNRAMTEVRGQAGMSALLGVVSLSQMRSEVADTKGHKTSRPSSTEAMGGTWSRRTKSWVFLASVEKEPETPGPAAPGPDERGRVGSSCPAAPAPEPAETQGRADASPHWRDQTLVAGAGAPNVHLTQTRDTCPTHQAAAPNEPPASPAHAGQCVDGGPACRR